ncbi:response regulator transcription factor [Amycolatopsis anabasis]|uniref:response regulator transcription factor n=1 Tax=Amycolatopsis anabasis TaxID=1840409 RepID=UPI00131DF853|nr:response regulator transcription factor [Amycolatopsis anabasis]
MIRVLLVDDDPLVCAHLRTILATADDITVVDEAYDGAAALDAVTRHRPDVVLMDLRMPGVDGLTATGRITALCEPPVVVALTTFDTDDHVLRALAAGAAGFLLKSTPPGDLIALVRVAADGHSVLSPSATRRLLDTAVGRAAERDERLDLIATLTEREREVLACLGHGMSNADIARHLHLSPTTVKGHVSRILVKLDCPNRNHAGLLAQQARLGHNRSAPSS